MIVNYTPQELQDFETDIGNCFNNKMIRAPIHLYDSNEKHILRVFEKVKQDDWVCATWRSHYQCLLKGVPKDLLKEKILEGRSIALCFKEYRVVCSAIVGGIPSIATGLAWGEKLKGTDNKVWCFVGDMSAATGAFNEAFRYGIAHYLPIVWVIEDNGKSVLTPTNAVWHDMHPCHDYSGPMCCKGEDYYEHPRGWFIYYKYDNKKYPHAGAGIRVIF